MPPKGPIGKHHCVLCNIFVDNNKRSVLQHEQGKTHLAKVTEQMSTRLQHLSITNTTKPIISPNITTQADPQNRFASSLGVYNQPSETNTNNASTTEQQPTDINTNNDTNQQQMNQAQTIQWIEYINDLKLKHFETYETYEKQCKDAGIDLNEYISILEAYIKANDDDINNNTINENDETIKTENDTTLSTTGDVGETWEIVDTKSESIHQDFKKSKPNDTINNNTNSRIPVQLSNAETDSLLDLVKSRNKKEEETNVEVELAVKKKKRKNIEPIDFE